MNFNELQYFIEKKMQMKAIYQPAIIISLLENKGKATVKELAYKIYFYDNSYTVEYLLDKINIKPGKVLEGHEIVKKENPNIYSLNGFNNLSEQEIETLKQICEEKIEWFKTKNKKYQ